MSLLSIIVSSDVFSIILFVLSSLIIIITIIIFKLYIAKLYNQRHQIDNSQTQQDKQKRWKEIMGWYSIFQICLNHNNNPDHLLNKLHLLFCFSVYMLFMGYELLLLKVKTRIDTNIYNEDMIAVCELLAGCLSAIWPTIVLILIDFFIRKNFYQIVSNSGDTAQKQENRVSNVKKCLYGTIMIVVTITCQLFHIQNLLIGQMRHRSTLSKLGTVTFASLVASKKIKILMMLPIILIYHQIIVILMSGIAFTLEICKIIRTKNKVGIETKVTTTMAAIIQQSHENIQNKCPALIFRSDLDEGSQIHNHPLPLSPINTRKYKQKTNTSLVKRSRYSSYCSNHKKQDQGQSLERQQQIIIGSFQFHQEDKNKENNYEKEHHGRQSSIQYKQRKYKKIHPLKIQDKNHICHDINFVHIHPQPHRYHTNNNYYFHDLGTVKQPTQQIQKKYSQQQTIKEPDKNLPKNSLYRRPGHKNRERRSLPTVYESPVNKEHQFCLQGLHQLQPWKH